MLYNLKYYMPSLGGGGADGEADGGADPVQMPHPILPPWLDPIVGSGPHLGKCVGTEPFIRNLHPWPSLICLMTCRIVVDVWKVLRT